MLALPDGRMYLKASWRGDHLITPTLALRLGFFWVREGTEPHPPMGPGLIGRHSDLPEKLV